MLNFNLDFKAPFKIKRNKNPSRVIILGYLRLGWMALFLLMTKRQSTITSSALMAKLLSQGRWMQTKESKRAIRPSPEWVYKECFQCRCLLDKDPVWESSPEPILFVLWVDQRSSPELLYLKTLSPRGLAGFHYLYMLFYEMSFIRGLNMQLWEHHLSGRTPCSLPHPFHGFAQHWGSLEGISSCTKCRGRQSSHGIALLLPKCLCVCMSWGWRTGELTFSKIEESIFSSEHQSISKDRRSHPVQGTGLTWGLCWDLFSRSITIWQPLLSALCLGFLPLGSDPDIVVVTKTLPHPPSALQHRDTAVHTSFRASKSMALHLRIPPSVLPSLPLCFPHRHSVQLWDEPNCGPYWQMSPRKKTQRLPRVWQFFFLWSRIPCTENRAHLRGKQLGGGQT